MEDEFTDSEREESENESSSEAEAKSGISADLIRGHINTIILRTLYERDKYGYEIIEEIESKSHGQYTLKQPTLYSALKRLESQGYINAYWKTDEVSQGGRRKYYTLTDSGREITERNQAEWEYSRTVIDNLISDRNFDFTQPPPAAVDFKILKNSTTRVPTVKENDEDRREVDYDEPEKDQVVEIRRVDATDIVVTESKEENANKAEELNTEETSPSAQPAGFSQIDTSAQQQLTEPTAQKYEQPVEQNPAQLSSENFQYTARESVRSSSNNEADDLSEEQRRILHENYLKLISEPGKKADDTPETPYAEKVDTEKLIYNNRPETERDYKNLINNIFIKTVRQEPAPVSSPPSPPPAQYVQTPTPSRESFIESVRIEDATLKAREDGLTVNTSESYAIENRKKRYDLGNAMFKSSLIVGVIMLLEFALCLIFRNNLGASPNESLPLTYPFVIFALAVVQVLLFGTLYFAGIGKSAKPSASVYVSACIIVTLIAVLIIVVTALLLNVNFSYAGDIMAKIFIPCLVALNIAVFGLILYLFSRR